MSVAVLFRLFGFGVVGIAGLSLLALLLGSAGGGQGAGVAQILLYYLGPFALGALAIGCLLLAIARGFDGAARRTGPKSDETPWYMQ